MTDQPTDQSKDQSKSEQPKSESGFQYSLNFTDEVDDEDILVSVDGVKIVTDAFSASYLKGTELDYVETLQGAGFKFNNPSAKRTCGCGSSFSA
jgi:iron-sulfur cluster assembly accessory protein